MDIEREMKTFYTIYANTISKNLASMRCCQLLISLCVPGSVVLDLGSGFSSFVLRYYQDRLGLDVWSVDNNKLWLDKTKEFCKQHNVSTDKFILWEELLTAARIQFDLIFFDIGTTKQRVSYMLPTLENLVHPKTFVVFDDIHKGIIQKGLENILTAYTYKEVGIKNQTMDEYGRYSRLIYTIRKK